MSLIIQDSVYVCLCLGIAVCTPTFMDSSTFTFRTALRNLVLSNMCISATQLRSLGSAASDYLGSYVTGLDETDIIVYLDAGML